MKVHFVLGEEEIIKPEKKKNLNLILSPIFLYFPSSSAFRTQAKTCTASASGSSHLPLSTSPLLRPSRRSDGLMIAIDSSMMEVDKSRYAGGRSLARSL